MAKDTPAPKVEETTQAGQDAAAQEAPAVTEAPVPETTQAPAATEAPTPTPASTQPPKPTSAPQQPQKAAGTTKTQAGQSFEDRIADLKVNGTVNQRTVIADLERYLDRMTPGRPIEGDAGAANQYALWLTLSKVIERMPHEEFKTLWTLVLMYFHQHRNGAFHDRYLFRFAEFWNQNTATLDAFQRLLNLIKLTADPAKRADGLRQVSIQRSLEVGFSEDGRQRLIQFYA